MNIIYGYIDTSDLASVNDLILDGNTSCNPDESLTKIKWNSPTPQAIADVVYAEMTQAEAMTFYKNPDNGWVPVV
jgi:hypothetical protein